MPRVLPAVDIDHAIEGRRAGKTFKEIAAELGRDPESLRVALKRRGIESPPVRRPTSRVLPSPGREVADRFTAGESVLALSESYGVSRSVVVRWLGQQGVETRSSSEAGALRMGRMSDEQRSSQTAAAHEAVRGRKKTDTVKAKIARGRQREQYGGRPSPRQNELASELARRGLAVSEELAIGPYNVDIALPGLSVAVEILGGFWHASKPIHQTRSPHILDAGWHLILVWDLPRHNLPVSPATADHIVAFADLARRDPSGPRQYRVIRGDGHVCATSTADGDDFTLVRPTVRKFHAGR